MKIKLIEKEGIGELLKAAAAEWAVYVPQRNSGEDIWFDELDKTQGEAVIDVVDTVVPPKDIFFPQFEPMFEFRDGTIRETVESSAKLLFGVRPCDFKGILFCDEFYKRNFEDKYYLSRIRNRFIVVKGCIRPPRSTCFCASAKTGPFADSGYDLQLIESEGPYIVEAGSKKGEEFFSNYAKFFKDSSPQAEKAIPGIKKKAAGSLELKVDFQKALDLMAKEDFVPEENYRRIGERCIYCGACLYTCPTCTCFNVFDNVRGNTGVRARNWDACVFEGYTRETSGHNPRKEKWQRTSRRYEHKLRYDYRATGMSGCIGCGRCLSNCPVDIGISKFIQEITGKRKIM